MSEADVIVVGGGGAGLAAAAEAAGLGRRVILLEKGRDLGGSTAWSVGSISATNTPQQRAAGIVELLNEHVRANGHGEDLRVHFAGCSSSCAQHQIADIGIEGTLKRVDGELVEAMDIRIGGRLGDDARFGEVVVRRVPHWDLDATLLRIFDLYEREHGPGETFRELAARLSADWWRERLAAPAVASP